jgi:RNA 3'-terminal phosphate cyclase
MHYLDIHFPETDWLLIRQALSLALLKNQPITITRGADFLAEHGEYLPFFEDIARASGSWGAGRLLADGSHVVYEPKPMKPGRFRFDTGRFSSAVEILLFVMPALFRGDFRSVLDLGGVTHSPFSCPTSFIKETILPALERLGFYGSLTLKRFGFYASGGGAMESRIYPREKGSGSVSAECAGLSLNGIKIFISHLDTGLAELEKSMLMERLAIDESRTAIIEVMDSDGPGNSMMVFADCGGLPVVLYRELRLFDEKGEIVLNEDALRGEIAGIESEANALKNGVLPERVIREMCPYIMLSDTGKGPAGVTPAAAMTEKLCEKFL